MELFIFICVVVVPTSVDDKKIFPTRLKFSSLKYSVENMYICMFSSAWMLLLFFMKMVNSKRHFGEVWTRVGLTERESDFMNRWTGVYQQNVSLSQYILYTTE